MEDVMDKKTYNLNVENDVTELRKSDLPENRSLNITLSTVMPKKLKTNSG